MEGNKHGNPFIVELSQPYRAKYFKAAYHFISGTYLFIDMEDKDTELYHEGDTFRKMVLSYSDHNDSDMISRTIFRNQIMVREYAEGHFDSSGH